jgi:8-oxo-dGTP pyrophosphatase MutT (NUDIX family)
MTLGDGTAQAPIPSATILMVRDAPAGLKVFLVERHGLSDVLGGAYVFPGGKLDCGDSELVDRLDQLPVTLRQALCEPGLDDLQAAALYVAAIREVFEEGGVLFAAFDADAARPALRAGGLPFAKLLDTVGVKLSASSLAPWSRWVTPAASVRARKHFDARFFVAAVPPGQEPVHDAHEATTSTWLAPTAALQAYWNGRIQLAPPQIMSLVHLSRYREVAGVLAEARSRNPPRIQPEVLHEGSVQMVCFPGDEAHSQRSPVMPGPTRLCWRNGRYEPDGGLQALVG